MVNRVKNCLRTTSRLGPSNVFHSSCTTKGTAKETKTSISQETTMTALALRKL